MTLTISSLGGTVSSKQHVRILLVEDDAVDRIACRRALQQHPGYEFDLFEADTGRQGLQLAHEHEFDCILLDYHLPDMTGLEFLGEIADETGKVQVPVLKLTGSDNVAIAVEAMKRGARDYLIKDNEGSYLELLPAVIERVLSEQRVLEERNHAEAQYRTLVERIPAISYVANLDLSGETIFISPQIGCLGFTPEEWIAQHDRWLQQVHPEDRDRVMQAYLHSRNTDEPFCCDYRIHTRTGEIRWFHDEASVVRDMQGKMLCLQGIMLDITEKKLMEDELAKHRYQLEQQVEHRTATLERRIATLEASSSRLCEMLEVRETALRQARLAGERSLLLHSLTEDAIIDVDTAGNVTFLNPAAARLLNIDADQALQRPLAEVLSLDGLPVEDLLKRGLGAKHEQVQITAAALRPKDHPPVTVSGWAAPVINTDGRGASLLVLLHADVREHAS